MMKPGGLPYRAEIDGLRAIAVASVVLYHMGVGPSSGFAGVDVFFVISGYLITALLYRERMTSRKIDLFAFYARRVRRIIPALVVVVVTTVAASTVLLSPFGEQLAVEKSAAASLLFVANFFFQSTTGGYFDGNSDLLPLLHLWSLAVEEQFYLFWPVTLIVVLRWPRAIVPVLTIAALVSIATAEFFIWSAPSVAFYQMPARLWELAVGGLIALQPSSQIQDGRFPAIAGLIGTLAGVAIPTTHFPGIGALPTVIGTSLTLYAIHGSTHLGIAGAVLRSRPFVSLGLISYSLYLWHWPLLALDRATRIGPSPILVRILLVVLACLLAFVTYRLVERPCRRFEPNVSAFKLVGAGVLASVSLAFFFLTLGSALNATPPHVPTAAEILAERTRRDVPDNTTRCYYPELEPLSVFPKAGCASVSSEPVQVVIWGDSYALSWEPFAWALAQRESVAAISYARGSCPPVLGYFVPARTSKPGDLCKGFNELVANQIKTMKAKTLIMAARWYSPHKRDGAGSPSDFGARLALTIEQILPYVGRIVLMGPTPTLRDTGPRCIEQSNIDACSVTREEFDQAAESARKLLKSLVRLSAKIEYVEPEDFFCTIEICPVLKDGYGLYSDDNHVSSTAARQFVSAYLASERLH